MRSTKYREGVEAQMDFDLGAKFGKFFVSENCALVKEAQEAPVEHTEGVS